MQYRLLPQTSARLETLRADFSGLDNLESVISKVLSSLQLESKENGNFDMVQNGTMPVEVFDGWFAELVHTELGKTLGIIRDKAVAKARQAGGGSASGAVLRRMYKNGYAGNINIGQNKRRLSSATRTVEEPTGGRSGKRRVRNVSNRTQQVRSYFGPDRGFILRFLEEGTDIRKTNTPYTVGRGSGATWGRRGAVGSRSFMSSMDGEMNNATQELGNTLIKKVENIISNS